MKNENELGRVILIGAGAGSYDMITLRGANALRLCDVVVYDSLIDIRLLDLCKENAEKLCVGKRAGQHSAKQEDINALLIRKAKVGKVVARLKGGDPFVFGRGGEEILALKEADIPFQIIPGVTSAVAVPELAGIPVTHRNTARSFHVITGHTAQDMLPENFKAYAKCGGTLIFLMGLKHLREIADRLIEEGMPPKTPAAVISQGGTAEQKAVHSDLDQIGRLVSQSDLKAPAIIVVGETAGFDLSSTYTAPLEHLNIAVTATPELSKKLISALGGLGAYVYRVGDFRIKENFSEDIDRAFENISDYDWLVISSPNGGEIFIKKLREKRIDLRKLSHLKIAVIGSGTAEKLEASGLYPDLIPNISTSEELGLALSQKVSKGEKVLIMRSSEGSPLLTKPLEENHIPYKDVHIYSPVYGGGKPINSDYAVFTSAGGVRSFFNSGGKLSEKCKAVAIGKITAHELEIFCVKNKITSDISSIEGIVNKILEEEKCEDSDV